MVRAMIPQPPAPRPGHDVAVGVIVPRDLPADILLPYARRAEELGFAELWVVEDLGFHGGVAQAAAVLAATERIRVGIGLLPTAARNVAFTAMEVNTLAAMFPGRLDLGLSHGMPGWIRQVGSWPASPVTLLREQLVALRGLLRGETVTVDGTYVRLRDVRLESPAPVPPTVLVGARRPRTMAVAGELADGTVLAEPVTAEYARIAVGQAGAPAGHRVIAYNLAAVDDDVEAARRRVRPGLEWVGEPDFAVQIEPLPFARELAELRAASADRAEFTRRLPDAWVDRLAHVGTPEDVRAGITALGQAGVTSVVLMPGGQEPLAALETFARVL